MYSLYILEIMLQRAEKTPVTDVQDKFFFLILKTNTSSFLINAAVLFKKISVEKKIVKKLSNHGM